MWLEHKGFLELIDNWWKSYDLQGDPDVVLPKKLILLKGDFKKGTKEVFDKPEDKKSRALARPEEIDHGMVFNQD